MPARPAVSVLCSWLATLGVVATAALVARLPSPAPEAVRAAAPSRPTTTVVVPTTAAPTTTT
ncbi:MAG TPA: hypothetical protein VJ804_09345, partial [Acidimicrobiales bacterium]|nr:hypothetical protein [Acidimicrobiales bacterium]